MNQISNWNQFRPIRIKFTYSESFSVVLSFFTFFFLFELQYRKTDNPPLIIRATEKKELHIENSFTYPNNVS